MYFVSSSPVDVSPWVECLWELRVDDEAGWQELVPAELSTDFIVSIGTPYRRRGRFGDVDVSRFHHLGVRKTPEHFIHVPSNHLFGIRLRPGAASQLFQCGGATLTEHLCAEDPLLRAFEGLTERVAAAVGGSDSTGPNVHRRAIQRILLAPLRTAMARCSRPLLICGILDVIREQHCYRVAELSRRTGLTERTLERRFKEELGVTPKFAARLIRAQRANEALSTGRREAAAVASEFGLSDQAHLCGETRRLLGHSPAGDRFQPPVCRISPRPGQKRDPGFAAWKHNAFESP